MKWFDREQSDWTIVLVILLLGFLFVIVAGKWALRFTPSWTLDTDMESRLDPNSDYLTRKPSGFIEPIDPAILTQPVWINVMFTPGASGSFATRTPLPESVHSVPTEQATLPVTTSTIAVTNTIAPTSTFVWLPLPATSTPKPKNSTPKVDLQITLNDSTTTYVVGGTLTYTIVVSNPGPSDVTGVTVMDVFPAQVSGAGWTCVAAGGAVCTAGGSGHINEVVDLPVGSSITYTVNVNINPGASGDLVNTATVNVPAGYAETDSSNNTFTDTDTPVISANLQITITDNATVYVPGRTGRYEIVVSNSGPSNINGATVTDNFLAPILTASGSCTVLGGATCSWSGSGNINDVVDLPFGSSITYLVDVTTDPVDFVNLVNTASVTGPGGYIESADTDQLLTAAAFGSPSAPNIGETKDGSITTISPPGSSVTLAFSTPLIVGAGNYLVYYEMAAGSGILMDRVSIELSDGYKWYPIFDWGDGDADLNSNLNIDNPLVGGNESDNRDISAGILLNSTGVTIQVDGVIPDGIYPYIRITDPGNDSGDGSDVDAIEVLP